MVLASSRQGCVRGDHGLGKVTALAHSSSRGKDVAVGWGVPCQGWISAVRGLLGAPSLAAPLPDLISHPNFPTSEVEEARVCKEKRRQLLQRYRASVVLPALEERDQRLYLASASSQVISPLGLTRLSLMPAPEAPSMELLEVDLGFHTWRFYRVWAVVRRTGAWPALCYTGGDLPGILGSCPLCGAHGISVDHCLCLCPGTLHHHLYAVDSPPPRSERSALLLRVLGPCVVSHRRLFHVTFVGRCVHACLSPGFPSDSQLDWPSHCLQESSSSDDDI